MKKKFFMLLTVLAILAMTGCQNSVQTDGPMLTVTGAPEATNTPGPTPTEEPEPTSTPESTPTEEPEPTVAPKPTPTEEPKATSTPEPTPTEEPKATATPEPTPAEEPTPTATPEPTPTEEPKATATPEPTPTNVPTPKPTEKPKATPTPKPIEKPKASKTIKVYCIEEIWDESDLIDYKYGEVSIEQDKLYRIAEQQDEAWGTVTREEVDAGIWFYENFEYEFTDGGDDWGWWITATKFKDKGIKDLKLYDEVIVLYKNAGCSGEDTIRFISLELSDGLFKDCKELESVEIDGRLSLCDNIFEGCTNLRTFKITANLRVGKYAFKDCVNLETVGAFVYVWVKEGSFYNCSSLREFVFEGEDDPDWGYVLGMGYVDFDSNDAYRAFYGCKSLKTFNWNGGNVPDEAFYGCESFENFGTSMYYVCGDVDKEWGDGKACAMLAVGKRAFYGCKNFNIDIEGVALGHGYDIGEEAFYGCESLTNKIEVGTTAYKRDGIYSDVTCIGDRAFYGCKNLTDVEIGKWCESIGDEAFYGCGNLTNLYIESSWRTKIGENAFYGTQYDGDLEPWFEEWDTF